MHLDSRDPALPRRLAAKLRHNLVTIGLYLLVRFVWLAGLLTVAALPVGGHGVAALSATIASIALDVVLPVALFALVERAITHARKRPPSLCSIYDVAFWRHERYWKVPAPGALRIFDGTPLKGAAWRLLGVRGGRRLCDDGCAIVDRTLVAFGSDCALNAGCTVQAHSLEDGAFKSAPIVLGDGCSVGTGALVHYGVVMQDGAEADADSFVMKGSVLPSRTRWRGNPATEIRRRADLPPSTPENVP